jgi:hypothetical protein
MANCEAENSEDQGLRLAQTNSYRTLAPLQNNES